MMEDKPVLDNQAVMKEATPEIRKQRRMAKRSFGNTACRLLLAADLLVVLTFGALELVGRSSGRNSAGAPLSVVFQYLLIAALFWGIPLLALSCWKLFAIRQKQIEESPWLYYAGLAAGAGIALILAILWLIFR